MTPLAVSPADSQHTATGPAGFLSRTERWLDERGKGAWIAVMILSFIFIWPLGLAILAYMIWSKRMFSGSCAQRSHSHRRMTRGSSGNAAFDAYRAEMLRRLEDEQAAFERAKEFLQVVRKIANFMMLIHVDKFW